MHSWYALSVKSKHEAAIQQSPYAAGVEFFHPTISEESLQRRGSRVRRESIDRPLFPGYLFARFDRNETAAVPGAQAQRPRNLKVGDVVAGRGIASTSRAAAVLSIAGVFDIVSFDGEPAAIPDDQIEAVRQLLASGRTVSPCPFVPVNKGDRVEIKYGSCAGLTGAVVQLRGKKSSVLFVVSVEGVKASLSVTVPRDCIRPLKSAA